MLAYLFAQKKDYRSELVKIFRYYFYQYYLQSILAMLLAPFFHSKYALDVNGHIIFGNQSSSLGNIPRLPTFTDEFIVTT